MYGVWEEYTESTCTHNAYEASMTRIILLGYNYYVRNQFDVWHHNGLVYADRIGQRLDLTI